MIRSGTLGSICPSAALAPLGVTPGVGTDVSLKRFETTTDRPGPPSISEVIAPASSRNDASVAPAPTWRRSTSSARRRLAVRNSESLASPRAVGREACWDTWLDPQPAGATAAASRMGTILARTRRAMLTRSARRQRRLGVGGQPVDDVDRRQHLPLVVEVHADDVRHQAAHSLAPLQTQEQRTVGVRLRAGAGRRRYVVDPVVDLEERAV